MEPGAITGKTFWFLDTRVTIHVSWRSGEDDISVVEHLARYGDSPPLHVHRTEDEVFHLLEGQLRLKVAEEERLLSSGQTLLAPKGIPHTYRVLSPDGARWLTVTSHRDFENFLVAMGRPAQTPGLPPAGKPTLEDVAQLTEVARAHGIDIVGPPLS
jgi:quercetin dioxygenase-like cupin family protein